MSPSSWILLIFSFTFVCIHCFYPVHQKTFAILKQHFFVFCSYCTLAMGQCFTTNYKNVTKVKPNIIALGLTKSLKRSLQCGSSHTVFVELPNKSQCNHYNVHDIEHIFTTSSKSHHQNALQWSTLYISDFKEKSSMCQHYNQTLQKMGLRWIHTVQFTDPICTKCKTLNRSVKILIP